MGMTREEAINVITNADLSKVEDRVIKAIFYLCTNKALEQEPCEKYIKEIDHLRKYISKLKTQIIEQDNADTCYGCAFEDVEEWEMPCSKCKRNCKDYWRPGKEK